MPGERSQSLNWTEAEDAALRKVVNKELEDLHRARATTSSKGDSQPITWVKVAAKMNGRNAKQCRERWKNALDPSIRRTAWLPEEDKMLMFSQMDIGNKWAQIASFLPGRTENSIKTRYKSILRARRRAWRKEEDETILRLVKEHGTQWSVIASELEGRTVNGTKLRHQQLMSGNTKPKYEIGAPEQALEEIEEEIARRERANSQSTIVSSFSSSNSTNPALNSSGHSGQNGFRQERKLQHISLKRQSCFNDTDYSSNDDRHACHSLYEDENYYQPNMKRSCISPVLSCGDSEISDIVHTGFNSQQYHAEKIERKEAPSQFSKMSKNAGGFSSVMAKLLTDTTEPEISQAPRMPTAALSSCRPRSESSIVFDFDVGTYMVDVEPEPMCQMNMQPLSMNRVNT